MRALTRRTWLPTHIFDSTTQVGQDHVATRVLLVLGTNNHLHQPVRPGEQYRWDLSLLEQPSKIWELPQKAPTSVRPVKLASQTDPSQEIPNPPNRSTELQNRPNSRQQQHETIGNSPRSSPEENPTKSLHWSDRWWAPVIPIRLGNSGWTAPAGQLPRIQLLISQFAPRIRTRLWDSRNTSWVLHSQDLVHQNLLNREESKKSH
jgi:hypothetical protein